jgi:phage/plasmid-associated DNA primase
LDKYTIEDETAVTPFDTLYTAYKNFVKTHGLGRELSRSAFDDYLETNNIEKRRINGVVHIVGLRLKDDKQPAPQDLLTDDDGSGQPPEPADQSYQDLFPF